MSQSRALVRILYRDSARVLTDIRGLLDGLNEALATLREDATTDEVNSLKHVTLESIWGVMDNAKTTVDVQARPASQVRVDPRDYRPS